MHRCYAMASLRSIPFPRRGSPVFTLVELMVAAGFGLMVWGVVLQA